MPEPRAIAGAESPRVAARVIALAAAGTVALLIVAIVVLAAVFPQRMGVQSAVRAQSFPAPGVSAAERQERLAREAHQRALLSGAGGRMPVDKAMAQIAARGPQAYDPVSEKPR